MEEICDVCATPESGTKLKASDIRKATDNGFDPAGLRLLPVRPGADLARSRATWRTLIDNNNTDWNLCAGCMAAVTPFLPGKAASKSQVLAKVAAGLSQCEPLFFSGKVAELAQLATTLISLDAKCGDAYAFRCFAVVLDNRSEKRTGRDLNQAMEDYFAAINLSLTTEAGAVCRLFIKLIEYDVVLRLANADLGSTIGFNYADPLCGGAFAILEKDSSKAESLLEKAKASAYPVVRMYGYAGIGLMKLFLHRDPKSALEAFKKAGNDDVDVRTLARSLEGEGHPAAVGVENRSSAAPVATAPKAAKSTCFIATAACGSPFAWEVELLREYRETILRPSRLGRLFVRCYERISPPAARWIEARPLARKLVRNLFIQPAADLAAVVLKRVKADHAGPSGR